MEYSFTVTGMTCSACSARVEKAARGVEGVEKATVNLISGSLTVSGKEGVEAAVMEAVKKEGYGIKKGFEHKRGGDRARMLGRHLIFSVPLVLLLMYVSMGHMIHAPMPMFLHDPLWSAAVQAALCLPVLIINRGYFVNGFKKLFRFAPNMDSLVALGSAVSFLYGIFAVVMIALGSDAYHGKLYFEGAAMIVTLITVGKFLEEKSKDKTMGAVEKLMKLSPDRAVVLRDGKEVEILSSELVKGDIIVLKQGFSVPADGILRKGGGYTEESAVTGESIPVEKTVGSKLICGTVFSDGYCLMEATAVGEDTTLFHIVKLVENANSTKVPIAGIADKVASVFVPVVIAISLISGLIWLLTGHSFEFSVNIAVSILVVSCPCALGLATPAALMAGTGKAAENGILVKSGEALQNLSEVSVVVLDKTGTVTYGRPVVVRFAVFGIPDDEFKGICRAAEKGSSHVLAKAVLAFTDGAEEKPADGFIARAGLGVECTVEGKKVLLGNRKLMETENIDLFCKDAVTEEESAGATVLILAVDGEIKGYMSIKDEIRSSSKRAVEDMKKLGKEVYILTGDNKLAAKAVGDELGVKAIAEVLPEDKYKFVEGKKAEGKKVMMIGDGVNDAPALSSADVGVAIGAGTDIAIGSAEVILVGNDLGDAVNALLVGKRVMRNIRENLFWAFIYNIILIPVAAGVLYPAWNVTLNPMIASLAMSLSSVCVVCNALRLRLMKFRPKETENKAFPAANASDKGNVTSNKDIISGEKTNAGEKGKEVFPKMIKVYVDGMMCEHCRKRVEGIFSSLGLEGKVDLAEKVVYCPDLKGKEDDLKKQIADAGYEVVKIEA